MPTDKQYKEVMEEVIAKQSDILGPDIAVVTARRVSELSVSDDGRIQKVDGTAEEAMKKLIDAYVSLSGDIVKSAMRSIFAKYDLDE